MYFLVNDSLKGLYLKVLSKNFPINYDIFSKKIYINPYISKNQPNLSLTAHSNKKNKVVYCLNLFIRFLRSIQLLIFFEKKISLSLFRVISP